MKTITNRNLVWIGLAWIMVLGMWSSHRAQAASPKEEMYRSEEAKADAEMMEPGSAAEMPAVMVPSPAEVPARMVQPRDMMAKIRAQDAELAEQVAQMNAAPADHKVDLLAELLTKMVEQRAEMHAHMEMMMENMRQRMPMYQDVKTNPN